MANVAEVTATSPPDVQEFGEKQMRGWPNRS